jgi:hypothetical protein
VQYGIELSIPVLRMYEGIGTAVFKTLALMAGVFAFVEILFVETKEIRIRHETMY